MVKYNINLEGKTVLVTGAAGFIGSNLVKPEGRIETVCRMVHSIF